MLHALDDEEIPWEKTIDFMTNVESKDVDVILRKVGDHRLMTPNDLKLFTDVLMSMVEKVREMEGQLLVSKL